MRSAVAGHVQQHQEAFYTVKGRLQVLFIQQANALQVLLAFLYRLITKTATVHRKLF